MSSETEIADIVNSLKESEGSQAISPRVKANLVMQGIRKLIPLYDDTASHSETLRYLLDQADLYIRNPETHEIIAKGMKNLATPYAA